MVFFMLECIDVCVGLVVGGIVLVVVLVGGGVCWCW